MHTKIEGKKITSLIADLVLYIENNKVELKLNKSIANIIFSDSFAYLIISAGSIAYLVPYFRHDSEHMSIVFYWMFLLAIFGIGFWYKGARRATCLVYFLLVLFVFVEYITHRMAGFYFHEIPYEIISILYNTNLDEIKSGLFLSKKEYQALCIISLLISYFIWGKKNLTRRHFVSFAPLILCVIFFGLTNNPFARTIDGIIKSNNDFKDSFEKIDARNKFRWGATSDVNEKQTVILFLGETHRGDYLSINGYRKNTTPNLLKENIISFKDAISQASQTLPSTPMILSRKSVFDKGIFPEKSLISAFKEAGFETWYISYLSPTHVGDNEINLIANEADHYIRSDVNVDTLRGILSKDSKKKLIVYKTVGSHFLYHTRYPPEYDQFKPSFNDENYKIPTLSDSAKLINSYANSILYSVDTQVSQFIQVLKKVDGLVSLSFVSDHGTSNFDDGKSLYGGNTKGNYNIALFFWFNDQYLKKYKDINYLMANSNKKITSEYFVDTMFHIGRIKVRTPKGADLFEKNLQERKRLVLYKDIYNYDADLQAVRLKP